MNKKKNAKLRIQEEAVREFAAHGFAGARMDRIAKAAEINKAMIFYYFSSKKILYRTIIKNALGELEIGRYPKAGDTNPTVRLGMVAVPRGKVVWADIKEKADHYTAWPFWFADSSKLTFQWMNRGQNNIKIYTVDLSTGKKKEIFDERQKSWVEFFEDLSLL